MSTAVRPITVPASRGPEMGTPRGGMTALRRREAISGVLFVLPFLVAFGVFLLYPFLHSLVLAFMEWDVASPPRWVGLANFVRAFKDPKFWWGIQVSLKMAVFGIPVSMAMSLGLALLLHNRLKGRAIFRTAFYIPNVLDAYVVGLIWVFIFAPNYGLFVRAMQALGITSFTRTGVLGNPATVIPGVILATSLKGCGFGMILFLAGLQNIPDEVYEAGEIDGALGFRRLVHITLPLLKPVILFLIITGLIGSFGSFVEIYAMTAGGPNIMVRGAAVGATRVVGYHIYSTAFEFWKMGWAAAMSFIVLIITLLISLVNMKFLGGRVDY